MKKILLSILAVSCFAANSLVSTKLPGQEIARGEVRVELSASDELFANPGMGWQTFGRFADEDKALAGLPSGSAYFRFYWREIQPKAEQIDFEKFNVLLAHARRAGQKLAFRIMCTGSGQYLDVPDWLKQRGCRGVEFEYGGGKHWVPDFTDPMFLEAHLGMIRQLGEHYDRNADLDLVDIGSVGLWGEWHMSGTTQLDTGKPVPLPPVETRMAIINAWCQAFPRTSKVMLIGSEEGMSAAAAKGCGWRADCLGDMGGFSKTWNHMDSFYLQQLEKTGAQQVWKSAPVAFESCWDMRKWKESGWDIQHIFDYALNCHASYVNNKSAPLPNGTRAEVERFLRRVGYRLTVRTVEHAAKSTPGTSSAVTLFWENLGAAPPYRDYRIGLRLDQEDVPATKPTYTVSEDSIKGWLPGKIQTRTMLRLPSTIAPGKYRLAVGLVEPGTLAPAVRLALSGRDPQGWYPLSQIAIAR